jgi:Flp pilus assembly protein TadB
MWTITPPRTPEDVARDIIAGLKDGRYTLDPTPDEPSGRSADRRPADQAISFAAAVLLASLLVHPLFLSPLSSTSVGIVTAVVVVVVVAKGFEVLIRQSLVWLRSE